MELFFNILFYYYGELSLLKISFEGMNVYNWLFSFNWLFGGLMVKWFVSVSVFIVEWMFGILSNFVDDLVLVKIEKKEIFFFREKVLLF